MNKRNLYTALFILLALYTFLLSGNERILVSPLSGVWHAKTALQLDKEIDSYLSKVNEKELNDIIGLILPHAAYRYSGETAAYGIKELAGKRYSKVFILGLSHYYPLSGKIALTTYDKIRTTLGDVNIDRDTVSKIAKALPDTAVVNDFAYNDEHSLLIQLPLLQKVLGNFQLIPIVVGNLNDSVAEKVAKELKKYIDSDTLVIASSDFTHYGARFGYQPFPNDFQIEKSLKKLDMGAVKCIEDKSPAEFYNYVQKTGATICGKYPILILLNMLPEDSKAVLLHYNTSGRQLDDFDSSVSYVSIAFTGKWNVMKEEIKEKKLLSEKDKSELLLLAGKTIGYYLKNKKMPTIKELSINVTENMKREMGAFVSLYESGRLRGCIGEIIPRRSLYKAVMAQAVNSAVNDYRFSPVKESELKNIKIEISALTPSHKVDSYKDIVIGRDGMTIYKNGHSAVFLPQVAPEQGWDLATTLSYLSLKAGLPMNAWKEGAAFTVFQAIVFNEPGLIKQK